MVDHDGPIGGTLLGGILAVGRVVCVKESAEVHGTLDRVQVYAEGEGVISIEPRF